MKKVIMILLILVLTFSLVLSSCGPIDSKEIQEEVEAGENLVEDAEETMSAVNSALESLSRLNPFGRRSLSTKKKKNKGRKKRFPTRKKTGKSLYYSIMPWFLYS